MKPKEEKRLKDEHSETEIKLRIRNKKSYSHVGDAVLGCIDGSVTTFAVVAGSAGAGFTSAVIIVLGFANLIADGFSMAVSNYLRTKSDREEVESARKQEEYHIETIPEGEKQEIRQIFTSKGFSGETLEQLVSVITGNKNEWVDTMITDELGLQIIGPHPVRAAVTTFVAFLVTGLIPLLPFLLVPRPLRIQLLISSVVTGFTFMSVGLIKGRILHCPMLKSGLVTLLTGGVAAVLAYLVGFILRRVYGL